MKNVFVFFIVALASAEDKIYTEVGGNVTIPCDLSSNITFNGTSVTRKDFGKYNCTDGKTYKLIQELPPELEKKLPKTTFVEKDKGTRLQCTVKSNSPTTNITWWRSNQRLSAVTLHTEDNLITSSLEVSKTELENNITFKCSASYKGDTHYIDSSTRIVIYELILSAANKTATSIWIRLSGEEIFEGTEVVIEKQSEVGETMEKKIVTSANNTRIVQFSGLLPYTQYTFVAYQIAGDNRGDNHNTSLKTNQAAPTVPTNVSVLNINANSLTVKWERPKLTNGEVTKFRISYSFHNGKTQEKNSVVKSTNLEERSVELKGLYAFVKYNVSVQEKTIEYGLPSSIEVTTSPGEPHAPANLKERSKTASSVEVIWDQIPSYLRGGDLQFYKIITRLPSNETVKEYAVTSNITIYNITDLRAFQNYSISVFGATTDHEGAKAKLSVLTAEARPSAPKNLSVEVLEKNKVMLTWAPPSDENGNILSFYIRYRVTCNSTCNSNRYRNKRSLPEYKNISKDYDVPPGPNYRTFYIQHGIEAFSQYEFQVREKTKVGWGKFSKKIIIITKQGAPSAPLQLEFSELTEDSVTIKWTKPLKPNGIISLYTVQLKSGDGIRLRKENVLGENVPLMMRFENLKSETTYQIVVKASTTVELGEPSDVLKFTTKGHSKGFPWHFVLIGCLATVLLIALTIAIFLLVSRRRSKYEEVQTHEKLDLTAINKSKVVPVHELKTYCAQQHANSDHGFQQEFESVRIPVHTFTWEHSQMPYNQSKNRYSNIVAYDHSRVILNMVDNDPSSSYINANFINGYQHQKKYIAAQGPLPETVLDFWRMVWEQNTPIIVMLTKLVEDNKIKCEQYWPEGKALQYKDIVVTVNSISEMTDYVVRVFTLHKINNPELGKREVRQFHYTAWPDHGVPAHPTSMLSFVRHVMSSVNNRRQDGPIVVHCSAGVGRTGTFIAIESSLRQIEHDQTVDVYGTVCRMRMQRNFMVQIEAQYTFIYDALLDSVICGNTEIPPTDLVSKIRMLNQIEHKTGKTHFHEEFKRLESGITSTESSFVDASNMENKQKNRLLNILPYDHNRVKLVPIAGCRQSDYVNASIVDGFQQRNAFIATQAPLENTVTDFWRMVQERNIHIIVMLTKLVEKGQEKCYLYWPQAGTVSYGNMYVELVNVRQEEEHIVLHELRLTNRETGKSWMVSHFMYLGWPDTGSPNSGTELINLIGCVQRAQKSVSNGGPTLVHCSGGVGRTGVFIAVFNSIEKLKAKNVVDVFQTIRQLRLQRVAMVQTLHQYIFCYQALKDYLDSFDLYTNVEC